MKLKDGEKAPSGEFACQNLNPSLDSVPSASEIPEEPPTADYDDDKGFLSLDENGSPRLFIDQDEQNGISMVNDMGPISNPEQNGSGSGDLNVNNDYLEQAEAAGANFGQSNMILCSPTRKCSTTTVLSQI